MPQTAHGRFLFMFLLLGSVVIVAVALGLAEALNEPVRLPGFAI